MEETEVIELEGNGHPRRPSREERQQRRVNARANLLWMYLKSFEGGGKRHTQDDLCEALGLGTDGRDLRKAVEVLEQRGWVKVDRHKKPHRYELLKNDTEETAE